MPWLGRSVEGVQGSVAVVTAGLGAGPVPSGVSSVPISGRSIGAGAVVPALLFLVYKYGLVAHEGWPEMPELEAILPGLAVGILTWVHHRANRLREDRDRTFLLRLVASGVVVPVPSNPYVREPIPPVPPAPVAVPLA